MTGVTTSDGHSTDRKNTRQPNVTSVCTHLVDDSGPHSNVFVFSREQHAPRRLKGLTSVTYIKRLGRPIRNRHIINPEINLNHVLGKHTTTIRVHFYKLLNTTIYLAIVRHDDLTLISRVCSSTVILRQILGPREVSVNYPERRATGNYTKL